MKVLRFEFGLSARKFEGFDLGSGSDSPKNPNRTGSAWFGSKLVCSLGFYILVAFIKRDSRTGLNRLD